jgi:hypothetical protein
MSPEQVQALAKTIKQSIAKGDKLKALTQEHNKDLVLDVEPLSFQRGDMPDEMDKFVFALNKPGEWVVFKDSPDTLVEIQLVKRGRLDLKDVSSKIEKKLQNQRLKEELVEVRKDSGIWLDEQYFGPPSKKASAEFPQGERD